MALPLIPIVLSAVGGWLVISGRRDAQKAKAAMEVAYQRLTTLTDQASQKGLVTLDVEAKVDALIKERTAVNELSVTFSAEEVFMRATAATDAAAEIGAQLSNALGVANPIEGPGWTAGDWATFVAVGAGIYVGYRLLFGDRSLLERFSDAYPKSKLPRYAGGRRRLTA